MVSMIVLPINGRMRINPEGSEATLGEFAAMPIKMPTSVMAWVGKDGRPVALWADDQRIHPRDFAAVLVAVEEYNLDVAKTAHYPEDDAPADVDETVEYPEPDVTAGDVVDDGDVPRWRDTIL
jgi:hypothetical protein